MQSRDVPELYAKAAARREPQEKRTDSTEESLISQQVCVAMPNYF